MALVIKDRVKETTTTTGTGNIALGGAVSNFVTFSSVLSDSDTTYYAIVDSNNSDFEVGLGTYASSGNTIARTTVLASSNSGSAVDLSAGSKVIFCAFPADKAVIEDANGVVSIENLQFDTNAIKATNTNGNIQLFPNGTGFTELYGNTNAGAIRFNCEVNTHGVTLKGPPHSASATYSLELPNADGSAGQLLKTDGSGKLAFTSSLPGITATASEINILDGVTATTAELNYVDGVTSNIQTQIDSISPSPTFTATASGALANGDKVVLNTNGTVTKAQITSYTSTLGTPAVWRSNTATFPSVVYSTGVDRVVFTSTAKQIYSGAVSSDGSSIGVGTGTGYGGPSYAGGNANYTDMAYDSNLDRVVIAYADSDNSDRGTCAVVQALANGSFTVSSTVTGNIFDSSSVAHTRIVYDANAQKVVVAYRESSVGKAVVGTVATDPSNPITFGTPVNFNGGGNAENMAMSYDANAQKIVIVYTDTSSSSDHGKAVVGTVSGTSISFGTPATFNSNGTPYVGIAYDDNAQKHLIAFRDNSDSNSGKGIVGTISGTSISFGSATQFETGESNYIDAAYIEDQQKVGVVYQDNGDSNKGKYVIGTISGTSVSFTTPAKFYDGAANYIRAAYTPDQDAFIISYQDSPNSSYGTAVTVHQVATSNLTATNYIGISDAAYSDGDTATIQIVGAVDDAQSSLTTGSQYYVQQDGTLNTTADTPSVYAGTAISGTKLAIQHPEIDQTLPLVLISHVTASSSTEIDLTGMSSAYKIYKVYFKGFPSGDMALQIRFFVDGAIADSSNTYAFLGIYSTQANNATSRYDNPFSAARIKWDGSSDWNDQFVGEITINASGDSSYGGVIATGSLAALYNTSGLRNSHITMAHKSGTSQVTGIRLYPSSGNFSTGEFYLFGVNA